MTFEYDWVSMWNNEYGWHCWNVNEKQKIMTTVWWHWMWIHVSNEMKWWKQCDGTECEGIWVMKWIDGNSDGTAENVNEI